MRRRSPLAALALLAVILAACAGTTLPVQRTWTLLLPAVQGAQALPVTVIDETGTVKLAELAGDRQAAMEGFGGAESVDGNASRILVTWVGGSCDERAELRYRKGADGGWEAVVTTTVRGDACDAAGYARSVILDLADGLTVDPATVDVVSGG